jgi:hypothetical protein
MLPLQCPVIVDQGVFEFSEVIEGVPLDQVGLGVVPGAHSNDRVRVGQGSVEVLNPIL